MGMSLLTKKRLKVYPYIFLALAVIIGGGNIVLGLMKGQGLTDLSGKPIFPDFAAFWSASFLALSQKPVDVYHFPHIREIILSVIGINYPVPWLYPPSFLLMVLPLALLPYLASAAVWLGVTMTGYLLVIYCIAPHPSTLLLALAFPGTFQNFFQGQNGFLSATFLGLGLLLLDRRPFLGGITLGLLSFKPQFMILIPLALAAGRRWQALAGVVAGAAGLAVISGLVLGFDTWTAFWDNLPFARRALEHGYVPWFKMPTTFVAVNMLGGGLRLAQALQGLVAGLAAAAVLLIWSWNAPLPIRGASLCLGILLLSPYAYDYDLAILALPIAWLAWDGVNKGWCRGEQTVLLLAWLTPFLAPLIARLTNLQLGPVLFLTFLFLLLLRGKPSGDVATKN
jgi:hypothetical protein